jgi:methyl-accepting chemotaxis protein
MVVETIIAPMIETFVGLRLSIDLSAAIEITTGYKVELNLNHKSFFSPVEDEITPLKTSISALRNELGTVVTDVAATRSTVATTNTELAATRTELNTAKTTLATQQTQINTIYNVLSGAVFL